MTGPSACYQAIDVSRLVSCALFFDRLRCDKPRPSAHAAATVRLDTATRRASLDHVSGSPHRAQELADLGFQPAAVAGQRLRGRKNL